MNGELFPSLVGFGQDEPLPECQHAKHARREQLTLDACIEVVCGGCWKVLGSVPAWQWRSGVRRCQCTDPCHADGQQGSFHRPFMLFRVEGMTDGLCAPCHYYHQGGFTVNAIAVTEADSRLGEAAPF